MRLCLAWLLAVASNYLHLVRIKGLAVVVDLEMNVLDEECPNFVAESVCIKVTLQRRQGQQSG